MTHSQTWSEGRRLWATLWPVVLVLLVTTVGWFLLSKLALQARVKDAAVIAKGPITADYDTAKAWATELLGVAGTLAGFLGIAAAAQRLQLDPTQRAQNAEGGILGILAGATLLGVGGWPVPVALAVMATGIATDRVVRTLLEQRNRTPGRSGP